MRIISGSNKGKKLIMPNDKTTRPLKDMAKESIFNILTHAKYINFHLKDTKILDLFSLNLLFQYYFQIFLDNLLNTKQRKYFLI